MIRIILFTLLLLSVFRDYPSWRRESRPPENLLQYPQHPQQGRWVPRQHDGSSDDRNGYMFAPPPAPLSLRGRAMSENDLRFDSSHWSPSISLSTSQTLNEVEEGAGIVAVNTTQSIRKKTTPPPRPPPPKWEQFHRRRASHHALFSISTAAHSIPHAPPYVPPLETSRQRSYSLPPERQEALHGCPHCSCRCSQSQTQQHMSTHPSSNQKQIQEQSFTHPPSSHNQAQFQEVLFAVSPPSPMFSRRSFKPVAPLSFERDLSVCADQQERVDPLPSAPAPTDCSVSK